MSRHTPSPTLGLPLPAEVSSALRDWAERVLMAAGAVVTWPEDKLAWWTPMEFYRKHIVEAADAWLDGRRRVGGITLNAFYDRLHSPQMPKCPRRNSSTGRLLSFAPTPEAVRFLTAPAQNGGGGHRRDFKQERTEETEVRSSPLPPLPLVQNHGEAVGA